jgi:hypothetical protein
VLIILSLFHVGADVMKLAWHALSDAEGFGSLPEFRGLNPQHTAVATGTGAEDLYRRDIDGRLGEFLCNLGDRAGRSSPWIRKPLFFLLSLSPAALAAFAKALPSSGMRSSWDRRAPCGKAETPSRFIPASRSALRMRLPSPGLSGTAT